jgi:hypothetical protein
MDNVQNSNSCIDIPQPQTYRSHYKYKLRTYIEQASKNSAKIEIFQKVKTIINGSFKGESNSSGHMVSNNTDIV